MNKESFVKELGHFSNLTTTMAESDKFSVNGGLLFYGDKVMSDEAISSVASWIGANKKFIEDCPPDLQITILDRLLFKNSVPKVVANNDMVMAFTDPHSLIINPEKMVESLEKTVDIADFERLYPTKGGYELYLVGEREQSVIVGDVVRGGAHIAFSPMGIFNPEVVGYVQRLVCTNGAVRNNTFSRYSYKHGDIYDWIANTVNIAVSGVDEEVERYRKMRELPLNGNTISVLNHLLESIPKKFHKMIQDLVMQKHPANIYELMNIVTEVASHRIDDARQIYATMASQSNLGDDLEFCSSCHQLLNAN